MILIHPYSTKLRDGRTNPKNYPFWKELIVKLSGCDIIQIGVNNEDQLVDDFRKNLPLKEIKRLLLECEFFISVDSFLPHLAHHVGVRGFVLWSVSDPLIYGYKNNINILKDRLFLRKDQFLDYHRPCYPDASMAEEELIKRAHTNPQDVFEIIKANRDINANINNIC